MSDVFEISLKHCILEVLDKLHEFQLINFLTEFFGFRSETDRKWNLVNQIKNQRACRLLLWLVPSISQKHADNLEQLGSDLVKLTLELLAIFVRVLRAISSFIQEL
jgi:hypothetical protein